MLSSKYRSEDPLSSHGSIGHCKSRTQLTRSRRSMLEQIATSRNSAIDKFSTKSREVSSSEHSVENKDLITSAEINRCKMQQFPLGQETRKHSGKNFLCNFIKFIFTSKNVFKQTIKIFFCINAESECLAIGMIKKGGEC